MTKRLKILASAAVIAIVAIGVWQFVRTRLSLSPGRELSLLAWQGYEESDYVAALERASGMKVHVTTYLQGEQMYTMFTEAPPGTYDVVVVDPEYGQKLFSARKLDVLDRSDWYYEDYIRKFQDGSPAKSSNAIFGVVARWGAMGIVYNTNEFTRAEVSHYAIFFAPKTKGRVGVLDWWLPSMGIFSLALQFNPPYDLNLEQLGQLKTSLLKLRPQVVSIQSEPGSLVDDLRSGRTSIVAGIGEWASALLQAEGKPIDYAIPAEGGIMWSEAFAIPSSATDKNKSREFVHVAMQPEILALLATRKAYYSQLSRRSAYRYVPESVRSALHSASPDDAAAIAERLQFRELPSDKTKEEDWVRVWATFKGSTQ